MNILFKPSRKPLLYKVDLKLYNDLSKVKENILTYKIEVSLIKETLKGYVLNFKRSELLFNKSKDHSPINEIIIIAGEILNDLILEISQYGEILKVRNLKEVRDKWKEIRFRIIETYQGPIVERIISPIENKLSDDTIFLNSLESDPFYNSFLSGIYGKYTSNQLTIDYIIPRIFGMGDLVVKKKNTVKQTTAKNIFVSSDIKVSAQSKALFSQKYTADDDINFAFDYRYEFSSDKCIQSIDISQELYQGCLKTNGSDISINLQV